MTNWSSPEEITKDSESFDKFMHTLLGLYVWEFVTSLPFDWQYITGKRRFKWPMIFYFAGRYFLLFALIGIAIALNVTKPVNCQALYTYNQIFGNASIGLASINLSLRTMAVWSQKWFIVLFLVLVILGHWVLLLHGVLLKAEWTANGCAITYTSNTLLAGTFIYTMCFDFTVLTLTAVKLGVATSCSRDRSKIVQLIFKDGLIYFIVAFGANAIATTFMLVDLNPVMSIIANVPAAIASNIVACRAVRRLSNYTSQSPEVFGTTQASTLAFSGGPGSRYTTRGIVSISEKKENLQLQMDTFQAAPGEISPSELASIRYDAAGRLVRMAETDSTTDVEASPVDEFKRPNLQ